MNLLTLLCHSREFRSQLESSRDRLYRLAYAWSHDPHLSDDLVQETLAKALKNSGQLRDPKAMNTWLFSILANCWRDHFRRSRATVDVDDIVYFHDVTPEHEHGQHEVVTRVRQAVAELPLAQRQVLTLVDLEGFSYIEVAQILEIPIGTVMSRLSRARRALKQYLLDLAPSETEQAPRAKLRSVP
ncbi:MAG: RNA polymerase subunit sigma-24 [Chromatiales bacterium 21-64-14]|nr:MAG: RNA polymerase subunit sigma-24 [Chromatiales bacterium 21-64-14]HQU16018.1 sigma-70 family RNA polymerase sigma factor [Gammaproteobacteria bacterium]